jgi:hypothetical protein
MADHGLFNELIKLRTGNVPAEAASGEGVAVAPVAVAPAAIATIVSEVDEIFPMIVCLATEKPL